MINCSGIKLPSPVKYFWDVVPGVFGQEEVLGSRKLAKTLKKIRRAFNMFFGRCD
jgi:hypothetical protein